MKAALRLFKKHPIALGFYLLFVFMWLRIITLNIELSGQANFINSSQRVMRGEGLGYLTITAVFISAAFAFVSRQKQCD